MSVPPRSHYCSRCLTSFPGSPEHCPNLSCKRAQPESGWGTIHQEDEIFDRNYRIIRLLAMGGAGITYLAREIGPDGEDIDPRLAIKVLFSSRNQGSYLRRLATEAQILQEMEHEHTAEYRGFVHRSGHSPYLLTRFEAGGSLLDHIRRVGTLPVRQAAAVGSQICMALEKSHEMGVIHRDLKPENVLIAAEVPPGQVPHCRVADFGIAKVSSSLNSNLTRAGAFVGTPHFAAPEQFLGGRVGTTSDTYAVGAILHFCMMGRHVMQFADRLPPEDSWQILVDSLPAQINRPDDPPEDVERMNRVLSVVMDPRAEHRCTATELAVMLSALVLGHEPVIPDRAALPLPSSATEAFPAGTWATAYPAHTVQTVPSSTIDPDAIPDTPPSVAPGTPEPPSREVVIKDAAEGASTGCVVGGVLAAGLLLVALAAGWAYQNRPDLLGLTPPALAADLPALTGHETDEPAMTDYRLLYESLEALGPWLQEGCSIPAGSTANLLLVVEGDGTVRSTTVTEGISDAVDSCLISSLPAATLNRGQPGPIQFPKVMTWE